ncbi:adenosylcobinamide-GDP ribazoletransferase [Roseovarius sp. D22-M7]|uniref:adenosylcobinamide-GDP ribazoletransferase n=1 Tax=Roseovarius sp. D22-M7 TaxID=3127116 RepID=UPI0030103D27
MAEIDTALMRARDVSQALTLLSRLPARATSHDRGARAAWAYPLAGLVIGGLAALGGAVAVWSGLPLPLAALVALALLIVCSGALHEDGLADTADGLWGGWTRERRLEIMKDSHIGTYGVIALCLSLGARWGALWLLFAQGPGPASAALLASAALSRALMPCVMATVPHARATGLSHSQGRPRPATAAVGLGLGCIAALLLTGGAGLWAVIWAVVVAALIARIAHARIGGQTGDILGATQQSVEIAILFSLLA